MRKNLFALLYFLCVSFLFGQLDTATDVVNAMWHEFGLGNEWYFESLEDYLKNGDVVTVQKVRNKYVEDGYNFYFTINRGADELILLKIAEKEGYFVYRIRITEFEENEFFKSIRKDFSWYSNNPNFGQLEEYGEDVVLELEEKLFYVIKSNFISLILFFSNGKLNRIEFINAPDG